MKDEIYRRIIVLCTLRTNLDSDLFQGTVRLAVASILTQHGLDNPEATLVLAQLLTPLITAELSSEREFLRSVSRGVDHPGCEKPGCATCRLRAWADSTPTAGAGADLDPELKRKIDEALRNARKGPTN